ncbi:hypothetical protein L218DRAFT_1004811 [Marasmius fiardii PR-910]|nr:hypothetical protein L218DRAFT_1004811 [Marasmius fiardii PR-910]
MFFQQIAYAALLVLCLLLAVVCQPNLALQIHTICTAYQELGTRVSNALRLQVGDTGQLTRQQNSVQRFLRLHNTPTAQQHRHLFDEEYQIITTSVTDMLDALQNALQVSEDIIEHPPLVPTVITHTGKRGRPRKEVDPNLLAAGLTYRGNTHLTPIFDCSVWALCRCALEYGIADPCPPVYVTYEDTETGELVQFYQLSTAPMSDLTDEELDMIVEHILEIFPAFGHRMILGHMKREVNDKQRKINSREARSSQYSKRDEIKV